MPAPYDYTVQRPDIMGAIGAYEAGRDRNRQMVQQGKQDMFAQYLPQALAGDKAAVEQANQNATPEQAMQLKNALMQMEDRQLQQTLQQQEKFARLAQWADTPEKWAQATQMAEAEGLKGASQVPFEQRGAKLAGMLSVKEQLDNEWKRREFQLRERDTNSSIAARNAAAARTAQGVGKPPNGYAWNADGTGLIPLPGGPADPARKLTEGQSKDLAYYNRGTAANAKLDDDRIKAMMNGGNTAGRSVPIIGNALQSDSSRQGVQAAKDFIAALLRKDTGAAVTPQEFEFYADIFIPAFGDDPVTLRQKAEARQKALEAIKSGLGGASSLADASPPPIEGSAGSEAATAGGPQEGATGVSKSGKPIVFTGGKWIYR